MHLLRAGFACLFLSVIACEGSTSNVVPPPKGGGGSGTQDQSGDDAGPSGDDTTVHGDDATVQDDGGGTGDDASTADLGYGCGSSLLPVPADPGVRGPWKVGVRTATIGRLTVEVTYPAKPGSEAGKPIVTYDVRSWLPVPEQKKVPDANSPAVTAIGGDIFRDLPIDDAHGPYPVIINIHGTASFRIANGSALAQWASRGFVVFSADYPGLDLTDMLATAADCQLADMTKASGMQDVPGDVKTQMDAINAPSGDVAFLAGHVDPNRIGITGHSQGACITATLTTDPHVQVVVPMAGSVQVAPSSTLKGLMFIAGMDDKVIAYANPLGSIGNVVCLQGNLQQSDTGAYMASPGPPAVNKRLVGITGGGHLVPTDLCQTNAQGRNAIQEAQMDGVCGINDAVVIGLPALFDCGTIDWQTGVHDVNYASTAAFEEVLMCRDHSAEFASLKTALPTVGDFQEAASSSAGDGGTASDQ
jgi:dienelactone hydrolase